MSAARDLATDLGLSVDDDSVISNAHLQSVFNGWLAANNKFHILAAAITWPQPLDSDSGIIFISKFAKGQLENEISEDGEALEVKKDIEGWSQALKLSESLHWVSFADHCGITRRRTRPNPPVFVKRSFAELMASSDRYDRSRTTG
jgi:hypothetical protein